MLSIISLFFLIILGDNGLIDLNRLKKQRNTLVEDNQRVQQEIQSLTIEIDRAKNDPEYIEAIARQELGMIGKDEVILKFDEDIKKQKK
jgi:cell division protein FtsB